MRNSITSYESENSDEKRQAAKAKILRCLFFAFVFLCLISGKTFGQTLTPEEIRQQIERLESKDVETRRDALHKLRTSESEEASRIATRGLDDKAEIVRATAPFSVLELPADEAAANLLPRLKDKSEFVRRETAYALGRTRSVIAVLPLLEILRRDKEYQVKCSAAVALGEIGELTATDSLTRILQTKPKEDEEFLRRAAARSIGQIAETTLQKEFLAQNEIKDYNRFVIENRKLLAVKYPSISNSVRVLIRVLQNPDEADDVKRESAFALGAIGDASAIPVLQSKLAAEDYYLVEISRRALQKISPSLTNP